MNFQLPSTSKQDDTEHFGSRDRRDEMKKLLIKANNIENETSNPGEMIKRTQEVVKEANMLFSKGTLKERVQRPSENLLDSQLLKASSDVLLLCSQAIGSNMNKYDKHELADHIKRNGDFWDFTFPLEAPPVAYLYGTFTPTPLPPRVRMRRANAQRRQAAPAKMPMKSDNVATQQDDTPTIAEKHYRFLKRICKDGPVSYFHVVLDPTSFSRTVENVYHLSFLARKCLISVYLDEAAGVPLVSTVSNKKRRRAENSSEKQFIVSLDMERWRELKEAFNVTESVLKLE